jgi:hypothetical protein
MWWIARPIKTGVYKSSATYPHIFSFFKYFNHFFVFLNMLHRVSMWICGFLMITTQKKALNNEGKAQKNPHLYKYGLKLELWMCEDTKTFSFDFLFQLLF